MNISELSREDLKTITESTDFPVLLMFSASWCETCSLQEQVLVELKKKWGAQVILGKVDMDKNPVTAAKNMIFSVPTLVLSRKGKPVGRIEGYAGTVKLESFRERHVHGVTNAV